MTFFEHQCVKQDDTILSALAKLDKLSGQAMVVFVQNRKEQVIGTLTDGDIRRALLRGLEPSANVCDVMKTEFAFLKTDENDHTLTINAYRKRNIMVVPLWMRIIILLRYTILGRYIRFYLLMLFLWQVERVNVCVL